MVRKLLIGATVLIVAVLVAVIAFGGKESVKADSTTTTRPSTTTSTAGSSTTTTAPSSAPSSTEVPPAPLWPVADGQTMPYGPGYVEGQGASDGALRNLGFTQFAVADWVGNERELTLARAKGEPLFAGVIATLANQPELKAQALQLGPNGLWEPVAGWSPESVPFRDALGTLLDGAFIGTIQQLPKGNYWITMATGIKSPWPIQVRGDELRFDAPLAVFGVVGDPQNCVSQFWVDRSGNVGWSCECDKGLRPKSPTTTPTPPTTTVKPPTTTSTPTTAPPITTPTTKVDRSPEDDLNDPDIKLPPTSAGPTPGAGSEPPPSSRDGGADGGNGDGGAGPGEGPQDTSHAGDSTPTTVACPFGDGNC